MQPPRRLVARQPSCAKKILYLSIYLCVECEPVRCAPAPSGRFESNSLIFLLIAGLIATRAQKKKNQPLQAQALNAVAAP